MTLSSDLISQFVKITNDDKQTKTETTVYGTTVEHDGSMYVKLDGSELLTPISTTTDTQPGERVAVRIKNHTATVTGNLTSPAARTDDLKNTATSLEGLASKISEFEIIISSQVTTEQLNAEKARIDTLQSETVVIKERITTNEADISNLKAENIVIDGKLSANEANITNLQTTKLDVTIADATYATIEDLEATNADIYNLEATYGEFVELATANFTSINSTIDNLNTTYANIDFSNIGSAAMEYLYSNSGLIENVVVNDGTITGRLIGVTIKGDSIEANTIVADRLVILGEDGLYYKLNTDGVVTEAEQTEYNSLNGQIITAKSITATQISVEDLVAFDATIGGFIITEESIYSGTKDSVDNTTRGIYLDNDGQVAFGDANSFVKFYKGTDESYKLAISADILVFGSNSTNIETVLDDIENTQITADNAQSTANATETRVTETEALIELLSECISMLVTDGNGASLMTQTENGWTFSTAELQSLVNDTSEGLNNLTHEVGDVNGTVSVLQQAVDDLGEIAEYVTIGTYEGEPCIELGEGDSEFKLRITNTRMMFMEGSSVLAYFNNQSFYVKKAVIEEELQQGGFVWKVRSNGNLGLVWKGGNS